ncbi:MAG: peptidylprolyl isomerase [Spirochaetales bacterium]|nr:peptidylprolyl isomerase [Spirochaetales bacterium]
MREVLFRILKAPILHFLILGTALFFLYNAFLPPEKEEIIITRQTMNSLVRAEQEVREELLSDEEIIAILENHIDEEVLIREAYRQGLDRSNYRVRKQLLDLMRSGLNENIPQPSEEELKQFFLENQSDFRLPALRNFKHVFFSGDNPRTPEDLDSFLAYFEEAGSDFNQAGDVFLNGNEFRHFSFEQCSIFFGREFAAALFDIPDSSWAGPVPSEDGVHYVLVEDVIPPQIPEYEDIRIYLGESYVYTRNKEIQERKIQKLRESYRIVLEESDNS